MARKFFYNGMELPDVAGLSPEQVRDVHVIQHPELANAAVQGPEKNGDDETWKFVRSLAAKG